MSLLGILEHSPDAVFVIDEEGYLIEANAVFSQNFGTLVTVGNIVDIWPELSSVWKSYISPTSFSELNPIREDVSANSHSDWSSTYDLEIYPVSDPNQNLLIGVARDVTQDRQERHRLEVQVTTDDLTGLFVRSQLDVLLDLEIRRAVRRKSVGCFLFIDVDGFKKTNDEHGHAEGDRLLKVTSEKLLGNLRNSDVVARIGGDEFGIVLADANLEQGTTKANSLALMLSQIAVGNESTGVRVSIGVSVFPEHGADVQTIIRRADRAMYFAKNSSSESAVAWSSLLSD
ncbi:MAG: GGDEF domain-containing protein [Chloroflexi bacterium]|nr:GGDEF domain-containing protein [Chloroflexota bacterium]